MSSPVLSPDNSYKDTDTGGFTVPFVLSILVHGGIVAALFFWQPNLPETENAGIETTFITAGELAEIEGQIRANAAQTARGNEGRDLNNAKLQSLQNQLQQAQNSELARREAEYQRQMERFAAEQDAEIMADRQAFANELAEIEAEEAAELAAARAAYENRDELTRQNQEGLNEARAARDQAINDAEEALRKSGGVSGSLTAGESHVRDVGGTGAAQSTAKSAGSGNRNDIVPALRRIIYSNWEVPSNAKGERVRASISVDASGNVLSVSTSGGTEALRASLEQAIRSSSPLSPIAGTEHRQLNITFIAE